MPQSLPLPVVSPRLLRPPHWCRAPAGGSSLALVQMRSGPVRPSAVLEQKRRAPDLQPGTEGPGGQAEEAALGCWQWGVRGGVFAGKWHCFGKSYPALIRITGSLLFCSTLLVSGPPACSLCSFSVLVLLDCVSLWVQQPDRGRNAERRGCLGHAGSPAPLKAAHPSQLMLACFLGQLGSSNC